MVDALLDMIGDLTETTPREYKCAVPFAGDFWRQTGKQLGIGAVLGFFEHEILVERIRQKGSQKRKEYPEDRRRVMYYHDHALDG